MTSIRFGGNTNRSWDEALAHKVFKAPDKVQKWIDNTVAKPAAGDQLTRSQKVGNYAIKTVGGLGKQIVDYDYRSFASMGKVMLSEPPKGALLLLLYPGTVGPRVYRAYQRGKENNDYREVWDILRRDMLGISLFVFALAPIVKGLSSIMEKRSQVKLLDPKTGDVLKYSDFKNYNIDKPQVLQALLAEGNGPALKKAVNGLTDGGLGKDMSKKIDGIKDTVNKLVDGFETLTKGETSPETLKKHAFAENGLIEKNAKAAHEAFEAAENEVTTQLKEAAKSQNTQLLNKAKKLPGEFRGVLKNYAKTRRLPSDVVSFMMVIGLIGYLPVWFNTQWNKYQFEQHKAKAKKQNEQNEAAPPPPPPAQKAVGSPFGFAAINRPAPATLTPFTPFASAFQNQTPLAYRPFSTLNPRQQNNPFFRQ